MGYTDYNFQSDPDFREPTSSSIFTLGRGAII